MQQEHARPAFVLEARLQHVHAQAVDVFDEAGADAGGKRDVGEGGGCHGPRAPLVVTAKRSASRDP